MTIQEFAEKVQDAVQTELGEDYRVKVQEVVKNNNVVLQGLVILTQERNVAPTIYLNPFWEAYEGGVTLASIVKKIMEIYQEDVPGASIDIEFFKEFDCVKDRICCRLINRDKNEELLEKIPHIEFLDLAICFYYAYQGDVLGDGSILIFNTHMEMWNASTAGLWDLAKENTPRLFPWECHSMQEILDGFMEEGETENLWEERREENSCTEDCGTADACTAGRKMTMWDMPVRILNNRSRIQGASCILYPGLLDSLAQEMGTDLFILPSSIHEVILMPGEEGDNTEILKEMILEVNSTQVEPEELLSNNLYYYDHVKKEVTIR